MIRPLGLALLSTVLLPAAFAAVADSASSARPLAVGAKVPSALVQAADGGELDLAAAVAGRKTLVVFYRGGWCPYCNKHLAELAGLEARLAELGWQILALSPDQPAALAATAAKNKAAYRLLSDRRMRASAAFGLAFRVDDATRERYRGYNIELAPIPGEPDARWLPLPAAYLVDSTGVIRFAHTDPDYKARVDGAALLETARSIK